MVGVPKDKPSGRRTRWIVVLAVVCAAAPTLLALLARHVRLPHDLYMLGFVWMALGAHLAVLLAVVGVALCPWRVTAGAAIWIGWAAIVAGLSVVPTNVYKRIYWATHEMDEIAPIVTADGLVRDATLSLKVAAVALVLGLAAVIVGRRRRRALSA
jgi:hypothetical protein